MLEITFEYWNKLAEQTIMISSLLGGFSIAVVANLLVSEINTRLFKNIMVAATLAAGFFLMTLFCMTKLLLMTTDGFPFKVVQDDLFVPRTIGSISFFLGIISLIVVISLAGWTKSKGMGKFTTAVGICTLIVTILMIT